ncbi:MAG: hypothetical protein K6F80_06590 [Oscillospiraceae bacterium]|nr:hypothetical protein [Oscillospiraceae bacterium]
MAFEGYFPKFTFNAKNTDNQRKGDGFGMIVKGVSMMADSFEGSEATDRLLDWFLSKGITTIDTVVIQHWHIDHFGGAVKMVESGKIRFKTVYAIDPLTYSHGVDESDNGRAVQEDIDNAYKAVRIFQAHGSKVLWKDHGDSIQVGDIHWDIFRKQPTEFTEYDDGHAYAFVNDGSLILYSPELKHMICSDGPCDQKDAIHYFQKKYGKKDILRSTSVTHHGGSYSRSNAEAFVDAGGIFAYESCIELNGPGTSDWTPYGTRRLVQQGVTVWMQDEDIYFYAGDGKFTIKQGSKSISFAVPYTTKAAEGWIHNTKGWWYRKSDGSWATGWQKINKKWYYFAASGYMVTGWLWDTDRRCWFYLDPVSGAMWASKWLTYKGRQCWLNPSGRAAMSETLTIDGKTYVFDKDCYVVENSAETKEQGPAIDRSKKFIDISEFQGDVDWEKAKADVGAVYIRCGYRGSLASSPSKYKKICYDAKWERNLAGAQDNGIPFSAYFFPTAVTEAEATEEAEWFYNLVKGLPLSFAPALDTENVWGPDREAGRANGLSKAERTKLLKIITDYFNARGMNIGIYASASWFTSKLSMTEFPDAVIKCTWVADSTGAVDYNGYYWLHQYEKGSVSGFSGDVDKNKVCNAIPPAFQNESTKKDNVQIYPTTDPVQISNSGSDENGNYKGGAAGDNTGKEWYIRDWYNRPWNCVLRHPDAEVRACLADLAIKAAKNDKIGYDQYQRQTYWTELQKVGYDPSKITTACEADCSAGVIANVKAVGHLLGRKELQTITCTYTGNMRASLKSAGFQCLTDSKYLSESSYLVAGDILLNDAHHTATAVTNGKNSGQSATQTSYQSASAESSTTSTDDVHAVKYSAVVATKTDLLSIRLGPGTSYGTCSFSPLAKDTKIEVCNHSVGKWLLIKYAGKYGDAYSDYIRKT